MEKLFGVIDIGSNSVRLMISDGEHTLQKWVNTTKLADGLAQAGSLQDAAMQRSLLAVQDFVQKARQLGAEVHIFATEAVRSAENGADFTKAIFDTTGVAVDIVCGEMEAKLGFVGASCGQNVCVVDIGGASTEIVCGEAGQICYAKSLPIGAVRLRDICGEDEQLLTEYIDKNIVNYGSVPKKKKLVAIGGTASTIVAILEQMERYDTAKVHNYKLYRSQVAEVYERVKNTPMQSRNAIKGLIEGRRDIIVGAAYELAKIMDMLGFDHLYVSESDNLEGYLMLNKDKF